MTVLNHAMVQQNQEVILALNDLKLNNKEAFIALMRAFSNRLDGHINGLLLADKNAVQRMQGRTSVYYELMEMMDNCERLASQIIEMRNKAQQHAPPTAAVTPSVPPPSADGPVNLINGANNV